MRKEIRRPDEEAMLRVLNNNKETAAGLILRLAWNMGLSVEEMRQLKWDEVSFSENQINLRSRSVPMDDATRPCLREHYEAASNKDGFVVITEARRRQMHRVYIFNIAREAMDEEGLTDITLTDLRNDFIIRQLEQNNPRYVARISGLTLSTLYRNFSQYQPPHGEEKPARPLTPQVDEFKLWRLMQAEAASPVGLCLWMSWQLGMSIREIVSLTWEQVDLKEGSIYLSDRTVKIGVTLGRHLQNANKNRNAEEDPHVLLTPHSRRPFDEARLSRSVLTALIRGGIDNINPRDLAQINRRDVMGTTILRYAMERGKVSRNEVMDLLSVSKYTAWDQLRRLTEEGKLIKVGIRYFPAGAVVPPNEQYETIRAYLEESGAAYRKDLADLLRLEPRQCGWLLRGMVEDGRLIKIGQRYTLPAREETAQYEILR